MNKMDMSKVINRKAIKTLNSTRKDLDGIFKELKDEAMNIETNNSE